MLVVYILVRLLKCMYIKKKAYFEKKKVDVVTFLFEAIPVGNMKQQFFFKYILCRHITLFYCCILDEHSAFLTCFYFSMYIPCTIRLVLHCVPH